MTTDLLPIVAGTPPPPSGAAARDEPPSAAEWTSPAAVQKKLGIMPPDPVTIMYGGSQAGKSTLMANLLRNPAYGYRDFYSQCFLIDEKFNSDPVLTVTAM